MKRRKNLLVYYRRMERKTASKYGYKEKRKEEEEKENCIDGLRNGAIRISGG
jgi:hypothetical protein